MNQITEEAPKMEPNAREFKMSKQNFAAISEVIYKYSGIVLKDIKEDMVYNRVC